MCGIDTSPLRWQSVDGNVSYKRTFSHIQNGLCYTAYHLYKLYTSCGRKQVKRKRPKMSQMIASLRTSTDKQDLKNQKLEILERARKKDLKVDEFVEITMPSRKTSKQRRIEEVLQMLVDSDTLIVTELSRLGRSTAEVIALVNE